MGKRRDPRQEDRRVAEDRREDGWRQTRQIGKVANSGEGITPNPPAANPAAGQQPAATRAGKPQYDQFFQLYATFVRSTVRCSLADGIAGKESGVYFLPLGFIPGPAALLHFKDGWVRIVEATPDVKKGLAVPTPWVPVTPDSARSENLPVQIWEALAEWQALLEGLGHEPSPWAGGYASRVLEGQTPQYLAMAMPRFRYRQGDPEVPFGTVLVPEKGGMKVEKTFNPSGIQGVPAEGTIVAHEVLRDEQGPIQKFLRTWALMESNFLGRYTARGEQCQYG
ncbi:MAG: hypothetical protein C0407_17685 [Desulfobacca sp.]|nr:hypothetical protein [Desulfobacca sp.]